MKKLLKQIMEATKDENFLHIFENLEVLISKVLSIFLLGVILVSIVDLGIILVEELFRPSDSEFGKKFLNILGLFLEVLIALEVLENITSYLRKHVIQIELVIVTSLIAVCRKIIIIDLDKLKTFDIFGLGFTIIALSISYWIIRTTIANNPK
ncbi:MAG: phosphate-starvation-inducible PsiE family protein [Stigonema ocellatum SAG 48.90 = DSM 106950]|nr:phosphate-starvation-inducible PsiE family protein [Stigonema ocellatum SAG 48.90 = DSM 106950]